MISFVPVNTTFSVAQFSERAHEEIDALLEQGHRPLVVGGTGLYLRAALTDLDLKPPPDPALREQIERELVELGLKALHSQLPRKPPMQCTRAIASGSCARSSSSGWGRSSTRPPISCGLTNLRRPAVLFGIVMDRDVLADRISERVDEMLAGGLVDEVELAIERGASKTARKAIGFREAEAVLNGELSLEEAAEQIKRRHRQYVRRQLTWMRKLPGVELMDRDRASVPRDAAAGILQRLPANVKS